jgi:hypothetical protein
MKLLLFFLPIILLMCSFGILIVFLKLYQHSRKGRRSPLTTQLLRSPGESLRRQIDDISIDVASYIFGSFLLVPFSFYYFSISQKATASVATRIITALGLLVIAGWYFYKLWQVLKERNKLRLGLDCETAVGQELNQLMLHGCRVYHYFPAEKFNIDHVVISPKGVLAVETKGRSKPNKKGGPSDATVVFDGNGLKFPHRFEKSPIDQAKRQAKWLSTWLSSAVGEPVSVQPVLALPGWFIQRERPADILIVNGKNPAMLLKWANGDSLSDSMIKRISHQIEQRCRDVEPVAYTEGKKKG